MEVEEPGLNLHSDVACSDPGGVSTVPAAYLGAQGQPRARCVEKLHVLSRETLDMRGLSW